MENDQTNSKTSEELPDDDSTNRKMEKDQIKPQNETATSDESLDDDDDWDDDRIPIARINCVGKPTIIDHSLQK